MGVAFNPKKPIMASSSNDGTVCLWDVSTHKLLGKPLKNPSKNYPALGSVAFSQDGLVVASGCYGSGLLWCVETRQLLEKSLFHHNFVRTIVFSPTESIAASSCDNGTMHLWDVSTWELGSSLTGDMDVRRDTNNITFSPDGSIVASLGSDNNKIIYLRRVSSIQKPMRKPLRGHSRQVTSIALSADESMMASSSEDETVRLWDMLTYALLGKPLKGHTRRVMSVAFTQINKLILASGSDDQTVRLWDVQTQQPLGPPLISHTKSIRSIAFNPAGSILAFGSYDKEVYLWDILKQKPLKTLKEHVNSVTSVAFNLKSSLMASASWDSTVCLWDMASYTLLRKFVVKPISNIENVTFSLDGRYNF